MQWTHTRGSGIKMSDVRQRQRGRAWGPEGAASGAGRAASVINNHKPADARTSRGATPAAR